MKRPQFIGVVIFLTGFFILQGCKKPESNIGSQLIPGEEVLNLNQTDTVSLLMYTIKADSLRSDELSANLIGEYMDPELGPTSASSYTQLLLDGQNVVFEEDSIILDSTVLSLKYNGFYGNLAQQTFAVYEVIEDLNIDSAYYTNSFINFDSSNNLIEPGYETVTPDPFNPVVVGNDTLDAQLRIKLQNSFGQSIIDADESTVLANDNLFLQFLKGIHIRTENALLPNEDGAIFYFDLENALSKVSLYYRHIVDGDTLEKEFELLIDDECARFTRTRHQYTGSNAGSALSDTSANLNAYVQTMAGLKTVIEFPFIDNLVDSQMIGLNKAELILPADYYIGSDQFPISQIVLRSINDEGNEAFLADAFDASYGNSGIYEDYEYRFIITKYLQSVVKGERKNELRLVPTVSSVTANRTVLSGPNSTNKRKPRLVLTYSNY